MSNAFIEHHDKWAANHPQSNNGYPTLRIATGTIQYRVLDETPTSRILHYKSIGNRVVICPEDGCLFCARGDEFSTKHYLNVVDRSDNTVKILEYSDAAGREMAELIQRIAEAPEEFASNHPQDYDMIMTRTGSGKKDTRYAATAVARDFDPTLYTLIDLESKLIPMSVEEQKKNQGVRDAPSAKISDRGLQRWQGAAPSQVVKTPEIKTVIDDDDTEVV